MPRKKETTTMVRVSWDAYEILRYNSYKTNKKYPEIIDELIKTLPKPSLVDKISRIIANK